MRASRFALAGLALAAFSAGAAAQGFGVGDKAPELNVAKVFRGEPINLADGKTINVIEFWATW